MKKDFYSAANQIDNFGFSNEGYGLAGTDLQRALMARLQGVPVQQAAPAQRNTPVYSLNPSIANAAAGASSMRVTITCTKTGTGSGNTSNKIFLFGGDAFTNASRGYNAVVSNSSLTTSTTVSNGKNVVKFKYAADGSNYSEYVVTLDTAGEYPFVLSTLTGSKKLLVTGAQMEISDATQTTQLTSPIQKFELDEFGKAETNDLTTPKDLYQQATNGIYLPHQYTISGREGLIVNMLEVNSFSVSFYFLINKLG